MGGAAAEGWSLLNKHKHNAESTVAQLVEEAVQLLLLWHPLHFCLLLIDNDAFYHPSTNTALLDLNRGNVALHRRRMTA